MATSDTVPSSEDLRECTVDFFLGGLAGACVFDDSFCYFRATQSLYGAVAWGRPVTRQYERLLGLHATAQQTASERHLSIIDLRSLDLVDGAGLALAAKHMLARRNTTETKIIRQAVVLPSGILPAATIAGLYHLSPPYHPLRLFTNLRQAVEWLQEPALSDVIGQIADRAHERQERLAPLVRARLAARPGLRSLNTVANELRVSPRTLQRRLRAEGTSFAAELRTTWFGQAQHQLAHTDSKLTAIAAELGFSSLQSFSAAFKRESGQYPGEWRSTTCAAPSTSAPPGLSSPASRRRHGSRCPG